VATIAKAARIETPLADWNWIGVKKMFRRDERASVDVGAAHKSVRPLDIRCVRFPLGALTFNGCADLINPHLSF
jgi:hypothetical protein